MSDKTFLAWPFFDDGHRSLAAELERWAGESLPPLLEGDVGARPAVVEGVLVEDVEGDRGLHRPRLAGEEKDAARGDAAAELLIKTVDERPDAVFLPHRGPFHRKEDL